jgi:hypothetical protein
VSLTSLTGARRRLLWCGVGTLLLALILGWSAARNEISGTALWKAPGKYSRVELVTREGSPAKFHETTNLRWAGAIVFLVAAFASFHFFRKLDDCSDE